MTLYPRLYAQRSLDICTVFLVTAFFLITFSLCSCAPVMVAMMPEDQRVLMYGEASALIELREKQLKILDADQAAGKTIDLEKKWATLSFLAWEYNKVGRFEDTIRLAETYKGEFEIDLEQFIKKAPKAAAHLPSDYRLQMFKGNEQTLLGAELSAYEEIGNSEKAISLAATLKEKQNVFLQETTQDPRHTQYLEIMQLQQDLQLLWQAIFEEDDNEVENLLSRVEKRAGISWQTYDSGDVVFVQTQQDTATPASAMMSPILSSLSPVYFQRGQYRRAELIERKRYQITQKLVDTNRALTHGNPAWHFVNIYSGGLLTKTDQMMGASQAGNELMLIKTLVKQEKWKEALPLAEKMARDIQEFKDHPLFQVRTWEVDKVLAEIHAANNNNEQSLLYYRRGIEAIENIRQDLSQTRNRILYAAAQTELYDGIIKSLIATNSFEEAFSYAERSRARSFLDMLAQQKKNTRLAPKNTLFREHVQVAEDLRRKEKSLQMNRGNENPDLLRSIQVQQRKLLNLENQIASQYPELACAVSVRVLSLEELRKDLAEDERLVEYHVADTYTVVWVIGPNTMTPHVLGHGREAIRQMVASCRSQITQRLPLHKFTSALQLHKMIISPLDDDLQGINRICFVPHGPLHYLPFQALHDGTSYLVERFVSYYLPSASVIQFLPGKRGRKAFDLLAMGNPSLERKELDLPSAEQEVKEISLLYPETTLLVRLGANVKSFMKLAPSYSILHLATHGVFLPQTPMKSGLLLTGASQVTPNLTADQIFNMEISPYLVTLSGCETALGKTTRGDEIIGLTRAFLTAGASSVVSSLWKVSDRSTAELMYDFYNNLQTNDKAHSLTLAQRNLLKKYQEPFFWAAFVLNGDWQ